MNPGAPIAVIAWVLVGCLSAFGLVMWWEERHRARWQQELDEIARIRTVLWQERQAALEAEQQQLEAEVARLLDVPSAWLSALEEIYDLPETG